jgi:hypothetical protein
MLVIISTISRVGGHAVLSAVHLRNLHYVRLVQHEASSLVHVHIFFAKASLVSATSLPILLHEQTGTIRHHVLCNLAGDGN